MQASASDLTPSRPIDPASPLGVKRLPEIPLGDPSGVDDFQARCDFADVADADQEAKERARGSFLHEFRRAKVIEDACDQVLYDALGKVVSLNRQLYQSCPVAVRGIDAHAVACETVDERMGRELRLLRRRVEAVRPETYLQHEMSELGDCESPPWSLGDLSLRPLPSPPASPAPRDDSQSDEALAPTWEDPDA